jgi:hypothetical protein
MRRAIATCLFTLGVILAGCSSSSAPPAAAAPNASDTLEGFEYRVLGDGKIQNPGDKIYGRGALVFATPLPEKDPVTLSFTFSIEDRGSLMFVARAAESLENGMHLLLERLGDRIKGKVISPGGVFDLGSELGQKLGDVSGLLSIQWEIKDGGTMRVLDQDGKAVASQSQLGAAPDRYFGLRLNDSAVFDVFTE